MIAGDRLSLAEHRAGVVDFVRQRLRAAYDLGGADRPCTTLTYAQSLDGSIAACPGKPLALSNPTSRAMTHGLRALHDGLLIGINTIIADDPQLTVRLVDGRNPRPIVLDSQLRFPLDARLLCPPCVPPIIAALSTACARKEKLLRAAGAQVVRFPARSDGLIPIAAVLRRLKRMGIHSLMVEGGAQVITSFLAAGHADQLVLTVSPRFVGGLRAVEFRQHPSQPLSPPISNVRYHALAGDLVICGDFLNEAVQPVAVPAETSLASVEA